ncbi:MAG: diguanylate cyclase [Nitrospirae bacterium]|nr:diguanylate cyclase [Nitrospirota bacterium]
MPFSERALIFFRAVNHLDPRQVYLTLRSQLSQVLHVKLFSLFIYDSDTSRLSLGVHNHPDLAEGLSVDSTQAAVMFQAMVGQESVLLADAHEYRPIGEARGKYETPDALIVPLRLGGQPVGVLNLNNPRAGRFSEADRQRADLIGQVLATVLMNAHLHQRVRELSTRDPLTGLVNHLHLHRALYFELMRSLRYARPFSCVMMDLDHFKRVNDTYGHVVGDAVLRQVSGIIRETVRDTDVAARYGGEEFALILPETGLEGAMVLSERLRVRIAAHPVALDERNLVVTASFGVASFPLSKIVHMSQLLRHADQALYEAKRRGRNRVEFYQERRIAQRCPAEWSVLYYAVGSAQGPREGRLCEISSSGARLLVGEQVPPGSRLKLDVPGGQGGEQTGVQAEGSAIWCRRDEGGGSGHLVGIRFEGVTPQGRRTLAGIVSRLLVKELSRVMVTDMGEMDKVATA